MDPVLKPQLWMPVVKEGRRRKIGGQGQNLGIHPIFGEERENEKSTWENVEECRKVAKI